MRPRTLFTAVLTVQLALFAAYGVHRLHLGVDFTDEGAYLAWPMRMLFGERPFTSELMTMIKPVEVYLAPLFRILPGITLYEFRLIGWACHVTACGVFAVWLFRLGAGPVLAPFIAGTPFFISHIFGLAPPSYNTLSGDGLLVGFSLLGCCWLDRERAGRTTGILAGAALFIATFAHPGLGAVAAFLLSRELWRHGLLGNVRRHQPTASNVAWLVFLGFWIVFAVYFAASGALTDWWARLALTRSFAVSSFNEGPINFLLQLVFFPFRHTPHAIIVTIGALVTAGMLALAARFRSSWFLGKATRFAALAGAGIPLLGWWTNPAYLTDAFAQATLVLITFCLVSRSTWPAGEEREAAMLVAAALLAGLVYATLTYNFGPHRSWISGILGLPFGFGTALVLLLRSSGAKLVWPGQVSLAAVLLGGAAGAMQNHYHSVYRDGAPEELTTPYRLAKFRGLVSTAERVAAVEQLHAYLAPKLTRGEPFLAFDNCPMLYYLFDVRPAYGLAWATRYSMSPAALDQLNREFQAGPLPRYAIRSLVSLASTVWATAPKTDYSNYGLNETLLAHYEPDRTIFPFEIWRLRESGAAPKP
jgi:hypothetical protein